MLNGLYFAGLASLTDPEYRIDKSEKFCAFGSLVNIKSYDYHSVLLERDSGFFDETDVFVGSSFGGYFAMCFAAMTGKLCICINPSLFLQKRLSVLKNMHPVELEFIKQESIDKIYYYDAVRKNAVNTHILMNRDDEVLNFQEVEKYSEEMGFHFYPFEKGGHVSLNYASEMHPVVQQIIKGDGVE